MLTDIQATNIEVVRRFVDDVLAHGRVDSIAELVADDFVSHTWGIDENGREMLRAVTERVHGSLKDVEFHIEDVVADGDRVALRLTSSATPVAEFMGVPPSGKRYTIGEMHFFRLRYGQIVEHWHQHDALGLMKQLGALPS